MFFESFWINSNPRSFSKAFYISSTSSVVKLEKKPFLIFADFFGGPPVSGVIWRIFSMSKIGVRSKTNDISINPATPFSSLPTIYKKGVDSPSFRRRCISVLTLTTMVYCATKSGANQQEEGSRIIQIMTLMSGLW